mmetsp:Transcript_10535/g.24452  ORF Transcript_10535/g.24452 Transcript_10535/m.24452 type:complete len:318 (-) Transcript_10535:3333-4286(-)
MQSIFNNAHINTRHLCLPPESSDPNFSGESFEELAQKHEKMALEIGEKAIKNALTKAKLTAEDIDYFAVVSTTGFICPSLTAHYVKLLNMRHDINRIDVVGMGCNAGLNGMQTVCNFCKVHPNTRGMLLCVEICSAMYVIDRKVVTAVVNSLFGDGAAATIVSSRGEDASSAQGAKILGFTSHIIPESIDAMRINIQDNKYAFYLDKQIPYVLGNHVKMPVDNLLERFNYKCRDIDHWIIHSGGRKVIDAIKYSLDITNYDVRHTIDVLKNYGNISSASFLFSYEKLLQENTVKKGDSIVMITMGPGATIECCIGEF